MIEGAQVHCYEIVGSTESELRESMNTLRPKDPHDNKSVDAYTAWYVKWNWPGYGNDNDCDLSAAEVTLTEVKVTMPKWEPPENASSLLINKWIKYIRILAMHEKGHVDHIVDNYLTIRKAIQNATCSTAEKAANTALADLREFDKNYDDETNHGATQGAVFP